MDPIELLKLAMTLITEGPAVVSFVRQTYALFEGGKITADELAQMWHQTGSDVKAARAKWEAAG